MLTITVLLSGFPAISPDDISRDSNVDLQDVILGVRNVAESAEISAPFKTNVERALSVLNVVAGLKTVIKSNKEKSSSTFSFQNFPCLISSFPTFNSFDNFIQIDELSFDYKSLNISPEYPPPRFA
jgi:hypothetical protein